MSEMAMFRQQPLSYEQNSSLIDRNSSRHRSKRKVSERVLTA
jgi:hypothetical protein